MPTMSPASLKNSDDFPRTPLILTASGLVIVAIAVIVFWVFCCRQNQPPDIKPTSTLSNGYAPIPIESFREPRNPAAQICPTSNGMPPPGMATSRSVPAVTHVQLESNGHLTSTENDAIIKKSSVMMNGRSNGLGTSTTNGNLKRHVEKRKSDFKEWYV